MSIAHPLAGLPAEYSSPTQGPGSAAEVATNKQDLDPKRYLMFTRPSFGVAMIRERICLRRSATGSVATGIPHIPSRLT